MKVIGLTGGSGSGKSSIAQYFCEKYNAYIIDADTIGHRVILRGKPAYDKIIDYFGEAILDKDKEIDRKKLGSMVFTDYNELIILNSITHPLIIEEIKKVINDINNNPKSHSFIIVDGALLIETEIYRFLDELWIVYADQKVRFQRLSNRDELSEQMIERRISSQMPWDQMKKYGDQIINNSSSFQQTMIQCDRIVEQLFHS